MIELRSEQSVYKISVKDCILIKFTCNEFLHRENHGSSEGGFLIPFIVPPHFLSHLDSHKTAPFNFYLFEDFLKIFYTTPSIAYF